MLQIQSSALLITVDEIISNSAIVIYGMFILYVYTFEVSCKFYKAPFCL